MDARWMSLYKEAVSGDWRLGCGNSKLEELVEIIGAAKMKAIQVFERHENGQVRKPMPCLIPIARLTPKP